MKRTIHIPDHVYDQAKAQANALGISLSSFVTMTLAGREGASPEPTDARQEVQAFIAAHPDIEAFRPEVLGGILGGMDYKAAYFAAKAEASQAVEAILGEVLAQVTPEEKMRNAVLLALKERTTPELYAQLAPRAKDLVWRKFHPQEAREFDRDALVRKIAFGKTLLLESQAGPERGESIESYELRRAITQKELEGTEEALRIFDDRTP